MGVVFFRKTTHLDPIETQYWFSGAFNAKYTLGFFRFPTLLLLSEEIREEVLRTFVSVQIETTQLSTTLRLRDHPY